MNPAPVALLAAVGLAASIGTARAGATMPALSLDELGRTAAIVMRGKVVAERTVRIDGILHGETLVAVSECWKGPCGERVIVRQVGGEHAQAVPAGQVFDFAVDDEVVLFLTQPSPATTLVGATQGVFRVVRSVATEAPTVVRDTRDVLFVSTRATSVFGSLETLPMAQLKDRVAPLVQR